MTRGEFRDSTSRYMCTIPIVFIQYCCSSLPVVAVGSAYSRSLRVAAPLGTVASALRHALRLRTRAGARGAYDACPRRAVRVERPGASARRDDPVCRENGYIVVKTDKYTINLAKDTTTYT